MFSRKSWPDELQYENVKSCRKSWPDEWTSSVSISQPQDPSGTVFMPTLDSDPNSWSASDRWSWRCFHWQSDTWQSNFDRLFQAGKMAPFCWGMCSICICIIFGGQVMCKSAVLEAIPLYRTSCKWKQFLLKLQERLIDGFWSPGATSPHHTPRLEGVLLGPVTKLPSAYQVLKYYNVTICLMAQHLPRKQQIQNPLPLMPFRIWESFTKVASPSEASIWLSPRQTWQKSQIHLGLVPWENVTRNWLSLKVDPPRNSHMGPTKREVRKIIDSKVPAKEGDVIVPRRVHLNQVMPILELQ